MSENLFLNFQLLVCCGLLHQLSVTEISDDFCHSVPGTVSLWNLLKSHFVFPPTILILIWSSSVLEISTCLLAVHMYSNLQDLEKFKGTVLRDFSSLVFFLHQKTFPEIKRHVYKVFRFF
jgi:hypothetical protein